MWAQDRDKAKEGRETKAARPAAASAGRKPGEAMTTLQGLVGNEAANKAFAAGAMPVQRMPRGSDPDRPKHKVTLSGHGRFGDMQMLPKNPDNPRSREKTPYFTVPAGFEIVVYAPPGSTLENQVGNRIESGSSPASRELELVNENSKRIPMPGDYPKTFPAGSAVINYKLMPLESQHLAEGATPVERGTLSETVKQLEQTRKDRIARGEEAPEVTLHYACCGVGGSANAEIDKIFQEYRGYSVMLRAASRSPSPEPKRRRR
jgi:hypothetical protein